MEQAHEEVEEVEGEAQPLEVARLVEEPKQEAQLLLPAGRRASVPWIFNHGVGFDNDTNFCETFCILTAFKAAYVGVYSFLSLCSMVGHSLLLEAEVRWAFFYSFDESIIVS